MAIKPVDFSSAASCSNPTCRADNATKRCARCAKVLYCNPKCQRSDWPAHKLVCKAPSDAQTSKAVSKALNLPPAKQEFLSYIQKNYQPLFASPQLENEIQDAEEVIVACFHGTQEDEIANSLEIQGMLNEGDIYTLEGQACMTPFPGQAKESRFKILGWDYIHGNKRQLEKVPDFWRFVELDSYAQAYGSQQEKASYLSDPNRENYYKQAHEFWNKRQESFKKALIETAALRKKSPHTKTVQLVGLDHVFKNPLRPFTHQSVDEVIKFLGSRKAVVLVPLRQEKYLAPYPQMKRDTEKKEDK